MVVNEKKENLFSEALLNIKIYIYDTFPRGDS